MTHEPRAPVRRSVDGIDWHLDAELADDLQSGVIARLQTLLGGDLGDVVKRNNVRTVIRYRPPEMDGRTIYLKAYHTPGLRDRIKTRLLSSRAANEWRVMRHGLAQGIPTVRPLLMGEKREGGRIVASYFASEGVDEPMDWVSRLAVVAGGPDGPARRRDMLEDLGRLVRLFHDRRLHHRDLHTNNILTRAGADGSVEVRIIDLHSGRITRMTGRKRLAGLSKLAHSLHTATTRMDRLRILRGYFGNSRQVAGLELRRARKAVEDGIERLEKRRLRSRTRRCLLTSSQFRSEDHGDVHVHRRTEIAFDTLREAVERHRDALRTPAELIKDGRTNRISRFDIALEPGGEPVAVCVKEFRQRGAADRLKGRFGHRRGVVSWIGAHGLSVRGFEVPRILGLLVPRAGAAGAQYFVMRWLDGWTRLDHYVLENWTDLPALKPEIQRKRRFVGTVAALFRQLAERDVYHGDLKATNILVRPDGPDGWELALLDTDSVRLDVRVSRRRRLKNLAQLYASITTDVTLADRVRFFRDYAADSPMWSERKACYREIARACAKKRMVQRQPIE